MLTQILAENQVSHLQIVDVDVAQLDQAQHFCCGLAAHIRHAICAQTNPLFVHHCQHPICKQSLQSLGPNMGTASARKTKVIQTLLADPALELAHLWTEQEHLQPLIQEIIPRRASQAEGAGRAVH